MKFLIVILALVVALGLGIRGCYSYGIRNVVHTRQVAPAFLEKHGFKVIAYQGFNAAFFTGGYAWFTLEKNGITYEASVGDWYGELQLYNLKAIDAIKP